ncbi:hypothetical protein OJF2_12590 [Aquisphaera giovannonii]|uniref:Uncharacterized protein n=2 Tax=Aquisphaera giovannonii TaxID=406548 RepID=A0A5B9VWY1_9BACT|nr:hypothetical protein OJF2_12590 [Aquisphaera giovannonii]
MSADLSSAISAIATAIGTFFGVLTFFVAVVALSSWRHQLVETQRYEAGRRYRTIVLKIRHELRRLAANDRMFVTSLFSYYRDDEFGVPSVFGPYLAWQNAVWNDQSKLLTDAASDLRAFLYEAEGLWGPMARVDTADLLSIADNVSLNYTKLINPLMSQPEPNFSELQKQIDYLCDENLNLDTAYSEKLEKAVEKALSVVERPIVGIGNCRKR